jgi:uncharacterized protein (TIGR03085 family)
LSGYAQSERRALTDLMRDAGPDAPTLCEGWTARDLAAHLVLRERRPDAAAGIAIPPLRAYTERVQRQVRDRPWPSLVDDVRAGPPVVLRLLDEPVNLVEMFVHHEDMRRARPGWTPRALDPGEERALWARLGLMARLLGRRFPAGVTLVAPGFGQVRARAGEPHVTVTGPPGELVLFMSGRQRAAAVDVAGPEDVVARVKDARLGL